MSFDLGGDSEVFLLLLSLLSSNTIVSSMKSVFGFFKLLYLLSEEGLRFGGGKSENIFCCKLFLILLSGG
jgi:hypothetical protein